MPEFDPKIFRERYQKLPIDLREAIFSEENSDKIQEIGKKYELYVDKMGELAEEAGFVMLGFTHPKDFISNLSKRLGVDMEKAKSIAKDVNEQIFAKVRESLKKIHKIGEEESVEEISKSQIPNSKQIPISNDQITKTAKTELEIAPTEEKPKIEEIKPTEEISTPHVEETTLHVEREEAKIEEKEILAEGIQRAPKQFREIKNGVEQAKKEAKYPGDVDPYKEPIE